MTSKGLANTDGLRSDRFPAIMIATLLTLAVACVVIFPWDRQISDWVTRLDFPGDLDKALMMSEVYAHGMGILLILLAVWQVTGAGSRKILVVAGAAFFPGLLVILVKLFFERWRPHWLRDHPELLTKSWPQFQLPWDFELVTRSSDAHSFPSGHAATAFGFAMGLSWLYPRGRATFLLIACLAAFQRVRSAAHFPTDVLVGAFLGVAGGWWATGQLDRWLNRVFRSPLSIQQTGQHTPSALVQEPISACSLPVSAHRQPESTTH